MDRDAVKTGVVLATINSAGKESKMVPAIVNTTKSGLKKVGPVMTMGFGGITTDKPSKVMVGLGMAGLVTSLVVTPVVWVKTAVGVSIGCFMLGFARGVRKSWEETRPHI